MMKMKGEAYNPADDGFVFSAKRFEVWKTREAHLRDALIAEKVAFNAVRFRAAAAKE